MQVVHPICCGIDGHPKQLTACLRHVGEDGTVYTEWCEFATTYGELLALRQWLARLLSWRAPGCTGNPSTMCGSRR